jgi:hypothetical protein
MAAAVDLDAAHAPITGGEQRIALRSQFFEGQIEMADSA